MQSLQDFNDNGDEEGYLLYADGEAVRATFQHGRRQAPFLEVASWFSFLILTSLVFYLCVCFVDMYIFASVH